MCAALRRQCSRLLFRTPTAKSAKLSLSESSQQRLSVYTRTSAPLRPLNGPATLNVNLNGPGPGARLRPPILASPLECRTDV